MKKNGYVFTFKPQKTKIFSVSKGAKRTAKIILSIIKTNIEEFIYA